MLDPWRRLKARTTADLVLWPMAVLALGFRIAQTLNGPGWDLRPVWEAARRFGHDAQLYGDPRFVYPPSAALLLSPIGPVPYHIVRYAFHGLDSLALVAGVVVSVAITKAKPMGATVAATLLGLAASRPVSDNLSLENVQCLIFLGEAIVLGLMLAGRWTSAGALLGLTLALKPVLLPMALLFLLFHRWRAALVTIAVPTALTLLAIAVNHDGIRFFTAALPLLMHGNTDDLQPYNASLTGALSNLHASGSLILAGRVAVVAAGAWALYRRRRACGRQPGSLELTELAMILLLTFFLASSATGGDYAIFLVPVLITVSLAGAAVRSIVLWAGVYLLFSLDNWSGRTSGFGPELGSSIRPAAGFLLVFGTLVAAARRMPKGQRESDDQGIGPSRDGILTVPSPAVRQR